MFPPATLFSSGTLSQFLSRLFGRHLTKPIAEFLDEFPRESDDVFPVIAPFGDLSGKSQLRFIPRPNRLPEKANLIPGVVDIELTGDRMPGPDPGDRAAAR